MSGTDEDPIINPPYKTPTGYSYAPPPVPEDPNMDPLAVAYLDAFHAPPDPRDPLPEAAGLQAQPGVLDDASGYQDAFVKPPDPRDPTETVILPGELIPLAGPEAEVAEAPPVNRDVPYAAQDGALLTCTMGNWDGEPTGYAYQWISGGLEVGTDSYIYNLVEADVGGAFSCTVTATNAFGATEAPASNEVTVGAWT